MNIIIFTNGPFEVNTYLLYMDNTAIVIDPGHDTFELENYLESEKLFLSHILATHGHVDHIAGITNLKKTYPNVPAMINAKDRYLVENASIQSRMFRVPDPGVIEINEFLPDSGNLNLKTFNFSLLHVPGHSKGSLCFKIENTVFTGDTLFAGSVGRSDLFDGNHSDLIKNIREKLLILPEETIIYPGHGNSSTIGSEKRENPFF